MVRYKVLKSSFTITSGSRSRVRQLQTHFLSNETAVLEEKIKVLGGSSTSIEGSEDALQKCLADIAQLQREIRDAAPNTTSYDQRLYSEVGRPP